MKVKVHVKCAPFSKTEQFMQDVIDEAHADLAAAYASNEELFQENKDLRVEVGHLQDEIKMLRHQVEAYEQEAENWVEDHRVMLELREEQAEYTDKLKSRLATACADRDNFEASFKQMTGWWEAAIAEKNNVQSELRSTQLELKDREERVFILEQRIEMLERENRELRSMADQLAAKVVTQNAEINRVTGEAYDLDQKNLELEMTVTELRNTVDFLKEENAKYRATVTFAKLNAAQEEVARLQDEIARLTTERDIAVKENSELIFQINALDDELTAAVNLKNEYAEQLGELRKQLNVKDSSTRNFWNFLVEHGIVKSEDEMGGTTNGTK